MACKKNFKKKISDEAIEKKIFPFDNKPQAEVLEILKPILPM